MANERVIVVFRREDEWLHDCLTRIVETKKAAGFASSLSYELVRLAKNGLTGSMDGAETDRKILRPTDGTKKS